MVYQTEEKLCGEAVARQILALVYRDERFEIASLTQDCSSFHGLKTELMLHGVNYVSVELDDLAELKPKDFPLIAQVIRGNSTHFLIIRKISKKRIYVMDPQFGEYTLRKEEFLEEFTKKAMLYVDKSSKPELERVHLMKTGENLGYLLLFLASLVSLFMFFYGMRFGLNFIYQIVFLCLGAITLLMQFMYNFFIEKRFEKRYLFKYLLKTNQPSDYKPLQTIFVETIKGVSNTLSFAAASFGFTLVLLWNDYYLSFIVLVALVFSCLRYPMKEEKNAVSRYCSLKELDFLSDLKGHQESYQLAKRKAEKLAATLVGEWLIEGMLLSVLILAEMMFQDKFTLDGFIFYFGISMSLSWILDRLFLSLFDRSKKITAINQLSFSFYAFLLQDKHLLDYNKLLKKGVTKDGKRETHS